MDLNALTARLAAVPSGIRTIAALGFAVCITLAILGAAIAHPQRVALFVAPLHDEQLGEVEERLAAWNVAFTPSADNVLVDRGRRNTLLLQLSLAGLPHEHIESSGDVLGKLGALTPQEVIEAQTRDGLAGDIELALRGIDGVQDARVILAPAKQGYFADEGSHEASASVRLRLAPGARLSPQAVSGIKSFVAASVPGLLSRSVTIVDDRGVALGENTSEGEQSDLQRSLQSALDEAIGVGVTIVRVHVDYNRRTIASRDVRRLPLSSLAIAESTQSEHYDETGKRYGKVDRQIDRGSDTQEINAAEQPGRIERISAAVFVDAARVPDLVQIKNLAAASLGIDAKRGDTLEVQAVQFAHPLLAKRDGWWLAYGALVPLLPTLVISVAIVVALRFAAPPVTTLARALGERIRVQRTTDAVRGAVPTSVRGALLHEPPHAAAAVISALPAATAAAVLDMYPEHERAAIIRRMQRPASPLLSDMEKFIQNA